MIKKLLALSVICFLLFTTVAFAKGKPADTGKKTVSEKFNKGERPYKDENYKEKKDKSNNAKNKTNNEIEPPDDNNDNDDQQGKPENPGEKGRLHAIEVKLAKWSRMPESALKGLWNSVLSIGKKIGFLPEKPGTEEPGDETPTIPPIEPID